MPYDRAVILSPAQRILERFQLTLDLYDLSERMLRQKLRRKHPQATDAELEVKVAEWIARRPGAEHGDGEGRPIAWPPRRG
jgi:hypothetical protein